MFNFQRLKTLLCLKGISKASAAPKCYRPLHLCPFSPLSLKFSTITWDHYPFAVSYLINNHGFSPKSALNASKHLRFETAEKPDSVVAFFRNHGFSESQINNVIRKAPNVLSFDPNKTLLPKFEFLASKGASCSDIAHAVTKSPTILYYSLEKRIIPTYALVRKFLQSDEETIDRLVNVPSFFVSDRAAENVKLLLDEGMTCSNISYLLRRRCSVLLFSELRKTVDEVKELGFDPSKSGFSLALLAKWVLPKHLWNSKADVFKSWGWPDEAILEAFKRQPNCMLVSKDKINALMGFWVNQLGWDPLLLVKGPWIFGLSLEKRIIPRASVVHYLISKGLRNKSASLFSPFIISEQLFLQKFVKCFKEEESSELFKLYIRKRKGNLEDNREDGCTWKLSNG